MRIATRAKILHGVGTGLLLVFVLQLVLAVVSEFAPPWFRYGHALYPLFIGRDPISLSNIFINFGLLVLALVAFFYADTLEGDTFFKENFLTRRSRRPRRDGSIHFRQ